MFLLCSINVRGLGPRKRDFVKDYIQKSNVDICCVQETLLSESPPASWWPGPSFWSPAMGKQGSVAILISDDFNGKVSQWRKDPDGRVLSILIQFNSFAINLVCIYAPATCLTDRKVFFETIHEYCFPADAITFAGDFNCYEYKFDKLGGNFAPAKYLSDFRKSLNLVDAWRKLHPRSREYSWFNSVFTLASRLDNFLVSSKMLSSIRSCEITPCCFSDHDFVNLCLEFDQAQVRGPGLWKFNASLLQENEFCALIEDRISYLSSCIDFFPSVKSWWDFFKTSIKSEIVFFSRNRRRSLSRERVLLVNRLVSLKRRLISGDSAVAIEISQLESELKALISRELEGSKIRSRVRWLEDGERPTRYFFQLEHERIARNFVTSILDSNDVEVFAREEIERAHVRFYSDLFSKEPINAVYKQICLDSIDKVLSAPQRDSCEGLLSLPELTDSLRSLNLGRSPGSDGLITEFYLHFWSSLGPLLLRVAEKCFLDGELAESMKESITHLIFKKRGDVKHLKTWRPISLLNVDYKIISKAITIRLSKVIESIVHSDQTCSVPGRTIFSNVSLLRNILDHIELTGECAILVNLDQEKAFDRVDRSFLLDVLRSYGFGPDFCHWISTFYDGAFMKILLNAWLADKIPLERGVRQGDPLSPLLYVLCVEVLANLIRRSPEISGFQLPGAKGQQARVRLYADDTTCVIKDVRSLTKLFECVNIYELGSGAKLNRSKTEAM